MHMRRIAAATILCLVLSLAVFTTGAFAKSAHTSVSANAATVATSDFLGGFGSFGFPFFGGFGGFGFPFFGGFSSFGFGGFGCGCGCFCC